MTAAPVAAVCSFAHSYSCLQYHTLRRRDDDDGPPVAVVARRPRATGEDDGASRQADRRRERAPRGEEAAQAPAGPPHRGASYSAAVEASPMTAAPMAAVCSFAHGVCLECLRALRLGLLESCLWRVLCTRRLSARAWGCV